MGGFANPIAGGSGILQYPQLQSPDFVHLVSGWRIGKDGTAEFQSLIIPPGSGGTTVFVQGTTPTAHHAGDIWYNSAAGFEASQWNGSAWVPFQYGTSAIANGAITAALIAANTITAAQIAAGTITATQIAANTITAAKLAAGIVVAGIVDATTITGANFIADGASGQILVYSGTPAAGNLLISVSGSAGSDSFGNPYAQGVGVHGAAAFFTMPSLDAAETGPGVLGTGIFGTAGHRQLEVELSTGALSSNNPSQLTLFSQSQDGTIPASAMLGQALTVGGPLTVGNLATVANGLAVGQGLGIQTVAAGGTINSALSGVRITVRPVTATAARTGVILQPGTADGQILYVPSNAPSGFTITFAATATSNVATGVATVIQPGQCAVFIWVASLSLWFIVQ